MTRLDGRTVGRAAAWLIAWTVASAPLAMSAAAQETATAPAEQAQPAAAAVVEREPAVGWLELEDELREGPIPYAWVTEQEAPPSLSGVLQKLRVVAEDDAYLGLVIYLDQPELSLSQIDALMDGIRQVRASGKKVITFSETYSLKEYLLASAADMVVLQHNGSVELHGLSVEEMYLAGLLAKIGAQADLLQIGQYKGADEALMRSEPSDAWSRNMDALLDDLYVGIVGRIAENRGMTLPEFEQVIADSWTMTDEQYLRRRVVDRVSDADLIAVTEVEFGTEFVWDDAMGESKVRQNVSNPFALFQMLFREPTANTRRPTIAVIHGEGPIVSGDSSMGDGPFASSTIGSATITEALGEALEDDNIKGVVVRLDSPGGSALASEIMWQSIRQVAEEKPVFISVGEMAASGGYYMACAGDQVFVAPQSIVGSIGVVSGKVVFGGTYDLLGIKVTRRSRGPLADLFNSVQPFTPEQREVVRGAMQTIYDRFVDRVRIGRGARIADVAQVAEGRLFTGRQAVANGMADQLGSLGDTVTALADELQLQIGRYDVLHLPHPMSLQDWINDVFGVRSSAQPAGQLQQIDLLGQSALGQTAWTQIRQVLTGLMLLRTEPVLTLMPHAIVIR